MSSSMLAGERKWSSSRRGGMTVLGKVAVPKPINLPSQKLENHGLDPNVEIVPKGSLSWGSRPSSSTSNPWGSSAVSSNADGTTVSPHQRPTSSGGLSRPSTAGSDRNDHSASTWGPNSRPSSASGVLTSNQSSLTSSRPLSADTRPGSSHLSRFAEPAYDNSVACGPNGTADKLSIPSKVNDFSLSSGDFPTLGSEKDNTTKSGEPHDHGSHERPGSGSGRIAPVKDDHKSGTVDTWTRDGSSHFDEGVRPNADNWQRDPHQYGNPNVPPQHYDAWQGPPMNAPPAVWYRGPPPAGPPYPHVPHGGYPMEPYPYYRPQMPPPLSNSQSGPPPGPGPRGHHPRNGDFYRPQMPDAFIRPGMPMRPGFYPGPVPYDGYYGPPMGYNPNDRDMPYMGMPPGPHGPPVYNMRPPQNPSELNDPHFRGGPGGVRGPVGNTFVSEQMDSHPPGESHGPYKVLRKHENERNADMEEDSWEQNIEKNDHARPSLHKNERGTNSRRNEDMSSRRNMHTNQGYPSDPVTVHSSHGPHKSKASNESWGNKSSFSEDSKDSTLIQKIEDLNVKARASDIRGDAEQINKLLINPKNNSTIAFGSISTTGDLAHSHDNSRQAHLGVRTRADHHTKGRISNQDTDGWRKKPPSLGSEAAALENQFSFETKDTGESLTQVVDPADGQAQRARMRELAKQRAIELQREEEERIREQKAKALAKLEELNRRTLAAADGTTQVAEKNNTSVSEQEDVDGSKKPTEPAIDTKAEVVAQISEISQQDPVDQSMHSKQSDTESKATHGNDVGANRQKRASHRQKQSVQVLESMVDKSTLSATGSEVITNPGSSVAVSGEAVQSQESTQQKKRNNKSSKNKHKLDDASASREVPESPPLDPNSNAMSVIDNKDAKQPNADQISSLPSNQHKPQHSRRMPRNPQANRFHVGDVAVWAPVRPHNKEETTQDNMALPEKAINSGQTNLKSKRAEMERYVPKPVAKELAQQGTVIQSTLPSSPKKPTLEDMTDTQAIPVPSNVGPTKSGDNKQQQQQVKPHGASRQRNQQDSKKGFHKSTSQSDQSNPNPIPVSTETNVVHEWDPSDGWFMPDEYPPTEIAPPPAPVVKDEGGFTSKGKKPAYKGQRNTVKEVEVDQTDRPASSKENRSSHWQPKPQPAYKGGWSGGGQTANSEVKRESRKYSQPDEPVHDQGHQEGRRERKPASFRGRDQNQGYGNMEDEAQFEQQQQQQNVSSGFRKYGGQNNNRSSGQDDKRKHNNYQQYANVNREKPRQNMHYEYQPVGSTNNNNNSNNNYNKSSHLDAHADAAPRYKERGSGQPRRGGGDFYGRNH
ncbi:protein MODIFIER OF SNC1 1-like [Bidens hawaiensis]|uniref:protein MODIFIER OF SNC1 1-like n=1 Tax=Bidens hawaiensis TaxID=980011 RepID=UPI00404A578F